MSNDLAVVGKDFAVVFFNALLICAQRPELKNPSLGEETVTKNLFELRSRPTPSHSESFSQVSCCDDLGLDRDSDGIHQLRSIPLQCLQNGGMEGGGVLGESIRSSDINIHLEARAELIRINVKNFSKHLKTKQSAITQTANNACRQQQHQALFVKSASQLFDLFPFLKYSSSLTQWPSPATRSLKTRGPILQQKNSFLCKLIRSQRRSVPFRSLMMKAPLNIHIPG
ncbi:hypothetical protein CEXT_387491 [Caerostris extrusa]|uniref:Uncharacterized protein n=1 Tax=Caerostris extrusa TaxID=172846 RepID=A0AAV4P4F0_CAEEX|nr:hypothetical protein CEXT_387491 [Caerostris extrusa]